VSPEREPPGGNPGAVQPSSLDGSRTDLILGQDGAEVKRPVVIICDSCGATFELPVSACINRFTTTCPECGWCAWLPRDCWPFEPAGGPLRQTLPRRP